MEYKNWTKEDFEGVIFNDECMVEKYKEPEGICVFRTISKDNILGSVHSGRLTHLTPER